MIDILSTIIPFLIFAIALFALIKSADVFVSNAEVLGKIFGLPHFVIGVMIIAIGTSLPELATAIVPIIRSTPENDLTPIVPANIIGSNIANILLGLGVASLFRTVKVERNLIDVDLPFLFASTSILLLFLYDGVLSRGEGFLLLIAFVIFIAFSVLSEQTDILAKQREKSKKDLARALFLLLISGAGIALSSDLTIANLEKISLIIGIPEAMASMFFLAIGTSFPEIFTTVLMVRKGFYSMAVGNILGSNIANSLGIMGIAGVISSLNVSSETVHLGLPFIAVATIYFIFASMDKKFQKWEGVMAIMIFVVFLGKLFALI